MSPLTMSATATMLQADNMSDREFNVARQEYMSVSADGFGGIGCSVGVSGNFPPAGVTPGNAGTPYIIPNGYVPQTTTDTNPFVPLEELLKRAHKWTREGDEDEVATILNNLKDMVEKMPDGSVKQAQRKILAQDAVNALATLLSESPPEKDE